MGRPPSRTPRLDYRHPQPVIGPDGYCQYCRGSSCCTHSVECTRANNHKGPCVTCGADIHDTHNTTGFGPVTRRTA